MILVFAGSGAAVAVDPAFLTTAGFFQELDPNIKANDLFKDTLSFIAENTGSNATPDIEHVLWALDELKDFATLKSEAFSSWLISNNRIRSHSSNQFEVGLITSNLHTLLIKTERLISNINRVVHDVYDKDPDNLNFSDNWYPLLRGIENLGERIDIFTTNYDLILERVIKSNFAIDDGRGTDTIRKLKTDLWKGKDQDFAQILSNRGLLTKLHGSIDWTRHRKGFIEFSTDFTQHERHAIIYPGFKGEPKEEPFISFHRYLEAMAIQASAIIFIGYAFRDGYINSIFRNRLQSTASVYVIGLGPAPTSIPFGEGRYEYFDGGFAPKAISDVLKRLEKRLSKKSE